LNGGENLSSSLARVAIKGITVNRARCLILFKSFRKEDVWVF
jgi:hypothetical protein